MSVSNSDAASVADASDAGAPALAAIPLVVDLDGTLVATDTLWESVLGVLRHRPWAATMLPFWLASGGRAGFKQRIAGRFVPNASLLPYRADVLKFLREQRSLGRSIILATAADRRIAQAVADHLEIFEGVIATEAGRNNKALAKADAIAEHVRGEFDYIGDSTADAPVFARCRRSYLVAPGRGARTSIARVCSPARIFENSTSRVTGALRALRPHQWMKNVLLIVPLITSHKLLGHDASGRPLLLDIAIAIAAFSAAASAVYLVNDLLDLEADRRHPKKRSRPLASGALPIPWALLMVPMLLALSLGLSALILPAKFLLMLAIYLGLTTLYSFWFKRQALLDVFCLAALYTHRILAGGAAVNVVISPWLLAFSMFLFLSLAFVKRYSELRLVGPASTRGYRAEDIELFRVVGPTSGYLAVLVMCLYINSDDVRKLYPSPAILWLITPVFLYWITRVWLLAQRDELPDDPVEFALTDAASWLAGFVVAAIVALATILR